MPLFLVLSLPLPKLWILRAQTGSNHANPWKEVFSKCSLNSFIHSVFLEHLLCARCGSINLGGIKSKQRVILALVVYLLVWGKRQCIENRTHMYILQCLRRISAVAWGAEFDREEGLQLYIGWSGKASLRS